MSILIEVAIAAISLIIGFAVDDQKLKDANAKTAHETRIRQIFDAVKARFGITYDQLNQAANKLDIKLNQLMDAAKGSARLSTASKILREFVKQYPDKVNEINNKKNQIQNLMNNIDAEKESAASKIQSSKRQGDDEYSNEQAYEDAVQLINKGNQIVNGTTSEVDTSLTTKPDEERTNSGMAGTFQATGPSGRTYNIPNTWHLH